MGLRTRALLLGFLVSSPSSSSQSVWAGEKKDCFRSLFTCSKVKTLDAISANSSVSGGAIKKRSRPPLRISLSLRQHDWRSPYRHWEYLPQKFNFVASKIRYFRRIHQLRTSMIVLTFIYHTCISVKFDTTASYCVMVFLSCFSSKRDGRDFSF